MKKVVALMLVLTMIFALTACAGSSKTTPEAPATGEGVAGDGSSTEPIEQTTASGEDLHFVYVSPLLSHPVWLIAKEGFDQACAELGIKGDWVGPQNISPEEMTKLVETAVAQKAYAVITQGLVPAQPVRLVTEAGIPVLIVDSDIPDVNRLAFFGKDVAVQTQLLKEAVQGKIGKDTPIVASVQVAALTYKIASDQIEAIEAAFADHPGGFTITNTTESKSEKMQATTEWENTFKAYPEINVAINLAAEAGPACAKVVEELGVKDEVLVFAVDDVDETLDLIRNDKIDGTIVTSFYNYGYQATYWLYQNITGERVPEQVFNDAGTVLVNKDNIDNYNEALKIKVDLPEK